MGKRFLLATAWLMLAALFALPGVAAGQGPTEDSVVGFAFVTPAGVSLGPTYTVNFPAENMGVTDALVLPTSKEQCKHGGWRNFPGFKNQGQCIRFVRHQARQACIFERAAIGRPAFRGKNGAGPQHRHALRNCVQQRISG